MSLLSTGSPTTGRRLPETKLLSNNGQASSFGHEASVSTADGKGATIQ